MFYNFRKGLLSFSHSDLVTDLNKIICCMMHVDTSPPSLSMRLYLYCVVVGKLIATFWRKIFSHMQYRAEFFYKLLIPYQGQKYPRGYFCASHGLCERSNQLLLQITRRNA